MIKDRNIVKPGTFKALDLQIKNLRKQFKTLSGEQSKTQKAIDDMKYGQRQSNHEQDTEGSAVPRSGKRKHAYVIPFLMHLNMLNRILATTRLQAIKEPDHQQMKMNAPARRQKIWKMRWKTSLKSLVERNGIISSETKVLLSRRCAYSPISGLFSKLTVYKMSFKDSKR